MPRIIVATVAGLAGMAAYLAAVLSLADALARLHWALQLLFYGLAGLAWVIPARWLMLWAARR
jgi:hypothetical protein